MSPTLYFSTPVKLAPPLTTQIFSPTSSLCAKFVLSHYIYSHWSLGFSPNCDKADIPQRFVKNPRPLSRERNHLSISAHRPERRGGGVVGGGSFRLKSMATFRAERPGEQKAKPLRTQTGRVPSPHTPAPAASPVQRALPAAARRESM